MWFYCLSALLNNVGGNYNNAAAFYDALSSVVFASAIKNAQIYLLQFIPTGSKILIAGGGTGWILDELTKLHPTGLHITYVEISAKMLTLSQKRNTGGNNVTFINAAIENVELANDFDVVITPFLFDNFSDATAKKIFLHLNHTLKPDGLWLFVDFELNGKWWQPLLLKTMHLFFRLLCGIEASRLPDVKSLFVAERYSVHQSKAFFGDFIKATAYRRSI